MKNALNTRKVVNEHKNQNLKLFQRTFGNESSTDCSRNKKDRKNSTHEEVQNVLIKDFVDPQSPQENLTQHDLASIDSFTKFELPNEEISNEELANSEELENEDSQFIQAECEILHVDDCMEGVIEIDGDSESEAKKLAEHLENVLFQRNVTDHDIENCVYCKKEVQEPEITQEEIIDENSCTCASGLNVENFKFQPDVVHFYTGLESFEKFMFVCETLGPAVDKLTYIYGKPPEHITPINRFFLTLIRLREHKTYFELSILFKTTIKQIDNIFVTWTRFMKLEWSEIDQWNDTELVKFYAPSDFKKKFPRVRVIVDGTEIKCDKPTEPTAQKATFSTYKNTNTVKVMIFSNPGGLNTALSDAYGGSASDRQVIERSQHILERLDPGDSVMADKGFDIEDILAGYGVSLNIPTFFKKCNQITPSILKKDRVISSKRVHIERVIGLGKTYKILRGPFNATETIIADDIIFCCFMLCNFRKPIIDKYA